MNKLAPFAISKTKSRVYEERLDSSLNDFQHDVSKIVSSSSFRRLKYKTQVFNYFNKDDLSRSRLTHSLEVGQTGILLAHKLNINADLVQAICLAHDLGHPPFGHNGQDVLNECVKQVGGTGFEHNLQSLRIVDTLEQHYINFRGLNLTFESREGILKHCSIQNASKLGDVGKRFLLSHRPSLEAQVADVADELTYTCHDIDDGLLANMLNIEQLQDNELFNHIFHKVTTQFSLQNRILHKELVRQLRDFLIADVTAQTISNIKLHNVITAKQVQLLPKLVTYSDAVKKQMLALKKFLFVNFYQIHSLNGTQELATKMITNLFNLYHQNVNLLPQTYQDQLLDTPLYQVISDYIAGMTDRYIVKQYQQFVSSII